MASGDERALPPEELDGVGLRIGLVRSRWNADIVERLCAGVERGLLHLGIPFDDILIETVPGSFEIPMACSILARSGKVDAIVTPVEQAMYPLLPLSAHVEVKASVGRSPNQEYMIPGEEHVQSDFPTTSPNLLPAMKFIKDAARFPVFDENELAAEKEVVLGELERNMSQPGYYLNQALLERLFYKYPSRKSPGGTRETVAAATTEKMRLIQSRYYVPNNAILIVAGAIWLARRPPVAVTG